MANDFIWYLCLISGALCYKQANKLPFLKGSLFTIYKIKFLVFFAFVTDLTKKSNH